MLSLVEAFVGFFSRIVAKSTAEKSDIRLLLLILFTVPASWFLMGWNPGLFILSGDALPGLVWVKKILQQGADWQRLYYLPDVLGGVAFSPLYGIMPIHNLAALLNLSATTTMNLTVFWTQSCLAFLGIRAVQDFRQTHLHPAVAVMLTWVVGFAPLWAWRWSGGHLNIVWGTMLFLILLSAVLVVRAATVTWTYLLVAGCGLIHTLASDGHQLKLYSVVFGAPILIPLLWTWAPRRFLAERKEVLLTLTTLFAGSALVIFPYFASTVFYAFGGDSVRSLASASVIYTYLTSSLRDWLTSLPWSKDIFLLGREKFLHHEINYPMGPLLLAFALLCARKHRPLGIGWLSSFVLSIVFSMNVQPFSTWLATLVPPLHSFRVPARAMLPACATLLALGPALVISDGVEKVRSPWVWAGAGPILFWLLPHHALEAAGWLGVVYFGFIVKRPSPAMGLALLSILSAGSLSQFKQRLEPFHENRVLEQAMTAAYRGVRSAVPDIDNPLQRVQLNFFIDPYSVNSTAAADASGLSGYMYPTGRFLRLYLGLNRLAYDPTLVFFPIVETLPAFNYLQQLYNVCCHLDLTPQGFKFALYQPTPGFAWFPAEIVKTSSFDELARLLHAAESNLHETLRQQVYLVESDPVVKQASFPTDLSQCPQSRIEQTQIGREGIWRLQVGTPASCIMVLATNYISSFHVSTGSGEALPVFPVYGALTGVSVPPGKHDIEVQLFPPLSAPMIVLSWAGWLLLFAAGWIHLRKSRP